MGRKIPGKKHRGVKDPFQQHAKRRAELETRINAPPKDVDEQTVPKSLDRVIRLKEAVKSGKITKIKKKKKKKKSGLITVGDEAPKRLHPKSKPDKIIPVFKQEPGESEYRFLNRVNSVTHNFLNETAFEKKYGVQVNRNPDTGNVEGLSKCKLSELDKIEVLRTKHKNIKIKKKEGAIKANMTKSQKKREKLKLKKEKKEMMRNENVKDFGDIKDHVKFGEVAHEPPQIKIRPKAADPTTSAKPGKKDLLLQSLLKTNEKPNKASKKTINKTGKLKNLSVGERRQVEKDQNDVIEAYRRLKAQRSTGVN